MPPHNSSAISSAYVACCRRWPTLGMNQFVVVLRSKIMANILVINADPKLKRLVKLAVPGMEHLVRYSDGLQIDHLQSSSRLDVVIARLVADDDQGPESLVELRQSFAAARLIVVAALHDPTLEGEKFQRVVRELRIEYCLLEPIESSSILHAVQAALALPKPS